MNNLFKITMLIVLCVFYAGSMAQGIIRVSNLHIAPAGFIENNTPQGIFYDIAKKIILDAGYTPEIQLLPYPRVLDNLASGRADMSILISNKAIEKTCDSIMPLAQVHSIIVGLKGHDFSELSSLQGKTVGVLRLAKYDRNFEKNTKIKKYEFNSYEQGLKMLLSKRFDAMAGTQISVYYTLAKQGYSHTLLGKPLIINSNSISIQYSKKSLNPQAKDLIAQAARRLLDKGELDKIIASYLSSPRI